MSVYQAPGATTPCASDPASLFVFHCCSAYFRYGPYNLGFASVLAGIEPLTGLNWSCALLLPRKPSHLTAAARCGAFLGSVKLSESQSYTPFEPGTAVQPYWVFGFSARLP